MAYLYEVVTKYPIPVINSCWEKCFLDPSDSYFLFADLVGFYAHWTYMRIFLSNYWWQRSDIWSQAAYRYPISWEAFLDPSDSYFLFANLCIYKCMLNVYKNQQNRQTGSRNLMDPKTLLTIWGTYMKLVTKYRISAINSCWEKCDEKCVSWEAFLDPSDSYFLFADFVDFYTHWTYMLINRKSHVGVSIGKFFNFNSF
jgi:hypothetical protein